MAYAGSVVNPPLPYIGGIPGGMTDGRQIIIQGTVPFHENAFTINLMSGSSLNPQSDTALHFNIRFNENCAVRNSLQNGSWGSEERTGGMPFQKNYPFEIIILCQHHHFKVAVNGKHFCEFRHRIAKHQVNTLAVISPAGQVSSIRFDGPGASMAQPAGGFPQGGGFQPAGAFQPPPPQPSGYPGAPMMNPPVPLVTPIQGGLYPGKMINISGVPNPTATRFTVNLQCGAYEGSDIALHFDVRFQAGADYNVVVRNSCQNGSWGAEEKQLPYFPFMPNASFDMIVLVEQNQFKVAVNNQHLFAFSHRIPFQRVDSLVIKGDVRLSQVRFQ
ncbi:galectin-9 [Mytilus galloprovincialis]|uniref:Galectin n=1 Tax=Mytilus galloprovincialis TaxID=29158 RepID=A0A8B6GQW5_MYTGA|nr:galectin-9 [Mytilus galloprovincialis]